MHDIKKNNLECALYVVATPIGNLRDISLRALEILSVADTVAAEDTRITQRLLTHHGISGKRLISLHQHNEAKATETIVKLLAQGKTVALVTDAGTPAISDPGGFVIQAVRNSGYRIIPIPGANAAIAALSASGLNLPHFLFYGFLPTKSSARQRNLETLVNLPYGLVFYEAPHRVVECVSDLHKILGGDRTIVFARELTKMFEHIHSCSLDAAADWLASDPNNLRGEFVLLVSGLASHSTELSPNTERILELLLQELPVKKAVQIATAISGEGRNKIYQRALTLTQNK